MGKKEYGYRLRFTYEGKRYEVSADTLEEAYTKKIRKIEALKDRSIIYSPQTTVDKWADICYKTYKSNVKGLPEMLLRYNKYISPVIGSVPVSKVTAIHCQGILNECSGMSFSHLDKLRQEIKFIFETAVDNDLIKKSPAAKIKLPEYLRGERRSITDQERKHIYLVYENYKPFLLFILMLECGCRPDEACKLVGHDIDHENRLLHIRGTKTAKSDRYVPIPGTLYDTIKDTKPFDPISPNNAGHAHTKSSYNDLRKRLKRELNLSMGCRTYRNALIPPYPLAEDFEPYCLRHTYCTDLCKANVDVRTAQRLMGHANIQITANIYTHVDKAQIMGAGELLETYLKMVR